jgi:magnesium chelatase accessory protein
MTATPPRSWSLDGADWPNRGTSRFVAAGDLVWHVQMMGSGPVVFLAHGTGAATHSWRDLMPALARHFTVVSADLPGHGFTAVPPWHGLSLPGMARDLKTLLGALDVTPVLAVGHSAGAAILARMCLDGLMAPAGLVSLNGAFIPFPGPGGTFFAPLARVLVGLPLLPQLFAWRAKDPRVTERLLAGTGSRLDAAGADLYARLIRNPDHAAAALRMMASWDLVPLLRDLPALAPALLLIVGEADRLIAPGDAQKLQRLLPQAEIAEMPGLGHLAHEERPQQTAELIVGFARRLRVLGAA